MADLPWFPVFVADWLTSDDVTLMLPEQEGAFFRLLLRAWGKGGAEPSLPAADADLAILSRLGRRWAKLGGLVRAQFTERDGRLYNERLSLVWNDQQLKHASAVARGKTGGEAKAAKGKLSSSSATSLTTDTVKQIEEEGVVPGPKGPRVLTPAPELALAPLGAAPPVAKGEKPPGKLLPADAAFAAGLLEQTTRSSAALSREESVAEAQRAVDTRARRAAIEKHYWDQIGAKYDAWALANERHATKHEDATRATLAIKIGEKMHPQQEKTYRRLVLTAWRDGPQAPWIPDLDTYIAEQEDKLLAPQRNGTSSHATV